jgi:hypothetical protein
MRANLINKYDKVTKLGTVARIYVYKVVTATDTELIDFELSQGVNYKVDEEGSPLFFTTNFEGNFVDLVKGKTKDRTSGMLVDAYRPMSSEDFELKRSIYTRSAVVVTPRALNVEATSQVDVKAEF